MKLKRICVGFWACFFIVSLCIREVKAQDAAFSQYYASGLYLNPAMAGIYSNLTFNSSYRNQWRSVANIPYVTNQISLIKPIYAKKGIEDSHLGGLGLSIYNDRAGDGNFKTIGINLNAAYNLWLSSNKMNCLTFGLQGGIVQRNIDFTNLQWGSQFNPYIGYDVTEFVSEESVNTAKIYADVSAGAIYYYNAGRDYSDKGYSAYAGFAAYHLSSPNESMVKGVINKVPYLFKLHAGFEVKAGERLNISPNVLVLSQNPYRQINAGAYFTYVFNDQKKFLAPRDVIFGGWYRLQDAFIASLGLGNDNYMIGFSYDYNASALKSISRGRGAYEISLTLMKVREGRSRRFYTPRI
ncbi:hypothetical protein CHU_1797 [Sporocytophaga myxococcoides]|uniref:Bacteroidetes-specific membrane protein n=1 Tax=Sporocytophaga myxococcoides TaxID=153721 RepID=A0A098LDA2_9BACT|nr:PorP/SprF family type IX secretion system membrane protein [Sporocytophaga myxococcoides]GAL84399.1 hypothetical protein CHU_1797 [Sporocytophaga myxococcoides]